MVLYVNCCPRADSRSDRLARALLDRIGEYEEICIYNEDIHPLEMDVLEARNAAIEAGDYSCDMFRYAKQFAAADEIVISAPFWDLSFPAKLKVYFENIYCMGIVTTFTPEGMPKGLCRAKKLYYVTTAGGPYVPDYSYGYIDKMAREYFGIEKTRLIYADMLDIVGFDAEAIMNEAILKLEGQLI